MRISSSSSTTITIPASVCIQYPRRRLSVLWRFLLPRKAKPVNGFLRPASARLPDGSGVQSMHDWIRNGFGAGARRRAQGQSQDEPAEDEVQPPACRGFGGGEKKRTGGRGHPLQ